MNKFLDVDPFLTPRSEIAESFLNELNALTAFHFEKSEVYGKIIRSLGLQIPAKKVEEVPFLPVKVFKNSRTVMSVNKGPSRIMLSSGTSGQNRSKIVIDRETSVRQNLVLRRIISSVVGEGKLPLVILDSNGAGSTKDEFSARVAGIRGFQLFASESLYALDSNDELNVEELLLFIHKHRHVPILFFGFTYIVWEKFILKLKKLNINLGLTKGYLFHGGGWKKAERAGVSHEMFRVTANEVLGNTRVINYYGMIEQTGSIYLECNEGYFHTSVFSEILIRDSKRFALAQIGELGLVQTLSLVPKSYPGHSLLTEDLGKVFGIDDCKCGWNGKYFAIYGRAQEVEIRGCSDV